MTSRSSSLKLVLGWSHSTKPCTTISTQSRDRIYPSSYNIYAQRRRLLWAGYVRISISQRVPSHWNIQITQPFEMYIAVSQGLPKSAVISAANAVARWVKKEEARLFLRDAPIF